MTRYATWVAVLLTGCASVIGVDDGETADGDVQGAGGAIGGGGAGASGAGGAGGEVGAGGSGAASSGGAGGAGASGGTGGTGGTGTGGGGGAPCTVMSPSQPLVAGQPGEITITYDEGLLNLQIAYTPTPTSAGAITLSSPGPPTYMWTQQLTPSAAGLLTAAFTADRPGGGQVEETCQLDVAAP